MSKELSKLGMVGIDKKFTASKSTNISHYVHQKTSISCFQIEIANKIRSEKTFELLSVFENILNEIMQIYYDSKCNNQVTKIKKL